MQNLAALTAFYKQADLGMRDLPFYNAALQVEATQARNYGDDELAVVVTPWFMNLVIFSDDDTCCRQQGAKRTLELPSGRYEFTQCWKASVGGFATCALFSPVLEFESQQDVMAVANAALDAVFDTQHAETTEWQQARDAQVKPAEPSKLDRRGFITAGLAKQQVTR